MPKLYKIRAGKHDFEVISSLFGQQENKSDTWRQKKRTVVFTFTGAVIDKDNVRGTPQSIRRTNRGYPDLPTSLSSVTSPPSHYYNTIYPSIINIIQNNYSEKNSFVVDINSITTPIILLTIGKIFVSAKREWTVPTRKPYWISRHQTPMWFLVRAIESNRHMKYVSIISNFRTIGNIWRGYIRFFIFSHTSNQDPSENWDVTHSKQIPPSPPKKKIKTISWI